MRSFFPFSFRPKVAFMCLVYLAGLMGANTRWASESYIKKSFSKAASASAAGAAVRHLHADTTPAESPEGEKVSEPSFQVFPLVNWSLIYLYICRD